MNKICCIYAIKDKRSDKVIYIGQTKDFNHRKSNHFAESNAPIDKYMFEQGRNNFEMYVLEELSDTISIEEMRNKEQYYIEKYNTIETGLNKWRSGNYSKGDKIKEYNNEYYKSDKWVEYNREYQREYRKSGKQRDYQREYQREYYWKKKQEKLNQSIL